MELVAGVPPRWLVTLNDGTNVEVWAYSVQGLSGPEDERDYTFGTLMDINEADQGRFEVLARTPADPRRVEVAIARFPRSAVRSVRSG